MSDVTSALIILSIGLVIALVGWYVGTHPDTEEKKHE